MLARIQFGFHRRMSGRLVLLSLNLIQARRLSANVHRSNLSGWAGHYTRPNLTSYLLTCPYEVVRFSIEYINCG